MDALRLCWPLLLLTCLSGCFSLSFGSKPPALTHKAPTLAGELTELKKLRDRGDITARDFDLGKHTLLTRYGRPTHDAPAHLDAPAHPDIQIATKPDRVDESVQTE